MCEPEGGGGGGGGEGEELSRSCCKETLGGFTSSYHLNDHIRKGSCLHAKSSREHSSQTLNFNFQKSIP